MSLKYEVKKKVTYELLKVEVDKDVFIKIEAEPYIGNEIKGTNKKAKMEPATLCIVTNLETGEVMEMIMYAVLLSSLQEKYPDNSFVGKMFKIKMNEKPEGRRYHTFSIDEIELKK